jgi:hypothetical protein
MYGAQSYIAGSIKAEIEVLPPALMQRKLTYCFLSILLVSADCDALQYV